MFLGKYLKVDNIFLEAIASLGLTFSLTHSVSQSLGHNLTILTILTGKVVNYLLSGG